MKLLVVVDSPDYSKALCNRLEKNEFAVVCAKNVAEAMERLAEHRNHIRAIIANLEGSDRMALDFAAAVQTLGFQMPFFLLSSDRSLTVKSALKAGATLFYKPVDAKKLAAAIHQSLR